MKTCGVLVTLGSLFVAASANAQDDEATAVEGVIVTAAPYAVSLDSATTHVEVLDQTDLQKAPPAGIGDLLAAVPGLRSSAYAPGASRPVIRGQAGPRVMVLQNGVGLVDASTLSPDHAVAADPMAAHRIEILRGPSALAYGGSAIGGVVNVIDDRIPQDRPSGRNSRLSASLGGPGDARSVAGGTTFAAGRMVATLTGDWSENDDVEIPKAADPSGLQHNTAARSRNLGGGVSRVGDRGFFGAAYRRTESLYGVPFDQGATPDPDAEGPVRIDLVQDRVDLRGARDVTLLGLSNVRFSAGWSDYRHAEIEAASGEVGTIFLTDGAEARIEFVQAERGNWQGAVGLQGLTRDLQAIGGEAFIPPAGIGEAGVFTLQRLDRGAWGLDFGLRVDRRALSAELSGRAGSEPAVTAGIDWASADADQDFTNVSASAGVFWRPSERAFYALSLSRNGRAPTEFELYADGPHPGTGAYELGDPELGSERVFSVEATGRWRSERLHLQIYLYGARYEGYIDQSPTGEIEDGLPVFRFVQTDAEFVGGELEGDIDLWRGADKALKLQLGLDWLRAASDLGPPARMPPAGGTVGFAWTGPRLDAAVDVRLVDGQDRTAGLEAPTKGHVFLGASLSWRPYEDRRLTVFLDGRNLTDAEGREHVSFLKDIAPLPGRTLRLGAAARF